MLIKVNWPTGKHHYTVITLSQLLGHRVCVCVRERQRERVNQNTCSIHVKYSILYNNNQNMFSGDILQGSTTSKKPQDTRTVSCYCFDKAANNRPES